MKWSDSTTSKKKPFMNAGGKQCGQSILAMLGGKRENREFISLQAKKKKKKKKNIGNFERRSPPALEKNKGVRFGFFLEGGGKKKVEPFLGWESGPVTGRRTPKNRKSKHSFDVQG